MYELFEARDAPLYHGTAFYNATRILATNTFDARTTQSSGSAFVLNADEALRGVSMSRDPRFARTFGPVVFVLDQTKLRHNYKIMPIDYWGHSNEISMGPESQKKKGKYAEAEEFVVGSITKADRYILSINVDSKFLKSYQQAVTDTNQLSILLDHPLLNMV